MDRFGLTDQLEADASPAAEIGTDRVRTSTNSDGLRQRSTFGLELRRQRKQQLCAQRARKHRILQL